MGGEVISNKMKVLVALVAQGIRIAVVPHNQIEKIFADDFEVSEEVLSHAQHR